MLRNAQKKLVVSLRLDARLVRARYAAALPRRAAVALLSLFASCLSVAGVAANAPGAQPADTAMAADFPSLVRAIKGRWSVVELSDNKGAKTPRRESKSGGWVWVGRS